MSFGTCCIQDGRNFIKLKPKSTKIHGFQHGLIIDFEIIQTFKNHKDTNEDISYIFPNDFKICIYDMKFILDTEEISMNLINKKDGSKIYTEAVKSGRSAVYGSYISNGLGEIKIGNLPSNKECQIILKAAFTANINDENSFFLKFPLDVVTPSGSLNCIDISKNFECRITTENDSIKSIKSNSGRFKYYKEKNMFKLITSYNYNFTNSILFTFCTNEKIESSALTYTIREGENIYDYSAVSIISNMIPMNYQEREFIFLVDCSGSMDGNPIQKAIECVEVFLTSLPNNAYFNIYLFGSRYVHAFKKSRKIDQEIIDKLLTRLPLIRASLGGTDIYSPLVEIFEQQPMFDQRQVFILTDGEVESREKVIELVRKNSNFNRCFTVGLGKFCDAGLLEGIASVSGGRCDFVSYGDMITEKVIPQLKSSFNQSLSNIEIHLEGEDNNSFEISPFPIPSIPFGHGKVVYLRAKRDNKSENKISKGIMICGNYGKESFEMPISNIKEDQLGSVFMKLFAFNIISEYEKKESLSIEEEELVVKMSLLSGILCKYTSYVGMNEASAEALYKIKEREAYSGCCRYCDTRPEPIFVDKFASDDDDEVENNIDDDDDDGDGVDIDEIVPNSINFDLISLLTCQRLDGCWIDLDKVNEIAGTKIKSIDGISISDPDILNSCIATIVAIAAIHVFAPDKKNTWCIVEEKGINWLKKIIPDANIDQIINDIQKILS